MRRIVGGLLILLLALPVLGDQDKAKDKPVTPEEQYKTLVQQQKDDMKAFLDAYEKAKTPDEKSKIVKEKYPNPEKVAPKFLEQAEKNPKAPAAVDALVWVATNTSGRGKDSLRAKALAILRRDHVRSDRIGPVCQSLAYGNDKKESDLLRDILANNPNKEVQAEASLALGLRLSRLAEVVGLLKEKPDMAKRYQQAYGKEYVEELRTMDAAELEAQSARYFKDFGAKYAAQMKPERLVQICQSLGRQRAAGGEVLLRAFVEHKARDVQGVACLALAQSLKHRADALSESQAKEAEKLRQESEELFDRATNKYADVKLPFRGTVGEQAKNTLFELRYLSIGKVVPEVEGEDADSKKFKLSDYRGKVVLLDFWGHW